MFYRLKDLQAFSLLATDGEIGRAYDFYFDDQDWKLHYLVAETGPWIEGRRILLSTAGAGEPVPGSKQIPVSLARVGVKDSPEIDLQEFFSVREVTGYAIHARDGEVGHVEDFLVDETWTIRYLIVDTGGWLPGRKVLFAPAWVTSIRKDRSEFEVDLSKETIKHSPEYDPQVYLDREYERSLYDHYGRSRDWD